MSPSTLHLHPFDEVIHDSIPSPSSLPFNLRNSICSPVPTHVSSFNFPSRNTSSSSVASLLENTDDDCTSPAPESVSGEITEDEFALLNHPLTQPKRCVQFSPSVTVVLIPSLPEYRAARLHCDLWYTREDFVDSREKAIEELMLVAKQANCRISVAKSLLYGMESTVFEWVLETASNTPRRRANGEQVMFLWDEEEDEEELRKEEAAAAAKDDSDDDFFHLLPCSSGGSGAELPFHYKDECISPSPILKAGVRAVVAASAAASAAAAAVSSDSKQFFTNRRGLLANGPVRAAAGAAIKGLMAHVNGKNEPQRLSSLQFCVVQPEPQPLKAYKESPSTTTKRHKGIELIALLGVFSVLLPLVGFYLLQLV